MTVPLRKYFLMSRYKAIYAGSGFKVIGEFIPSTRPYK